MYSYLLIARNWTKILKLKLSYFKDQFRIKFFRTDLKWNVNGDGDVERDTTKRDADRRQKKKTFQIFKTIEKNLLIYPIVNRRQLVRAYKIAILGTIKSGSKLIDGLTLTVIIIENFKWHAWLR